MPDNDFYQTLGTDFVAPTSPAKTGPHNIPLNRLPVEATGGTPLSSLHSSPAEPTPWVYSAKTGPIGPLTTGQFLAAIQCGDVGPKTKVRFMRSLEWIAAGEIPGLEFPSFSPLESISLTTASASHESIHNTEIRQLFAECITRQRSNQPLPTLAHSHRTSESLPTGWARGVSAGIAFVVGVFALILEWMLFAFGFAWRSRIAWAATCVLMLIVLIPKVTANWVTPEQDYATLSGTFAKWKELQSQNVDETIWDEFQERTASQLSELVPRLEKRAHITDKSSMSLMWVARDYLPNLLLDPANPSPEVSTRIETHFAIVAAARKNAAETPATLDPWMSVIIVLDLLVVFGAALFFVRKQWLEHFRKSPARSDLDASPRS